MVTLPRFVGSAVNDCRNSGTSEFIRIVKRQSGVPSSARKACGYEISKTLVGYKKIRTNSSYFFIVVTLPRFVGSAVSDCRNSETSEFIRIVKRQSGVPSSARKACGYEISKTLVGYKKIRTNSSYFFIVVTLPRFELGLPP